MTDFDYFVLFAEMRTGSNHLEESLKTIDGIDTCLLYTSDAADD